MPALADDAVIRSSDCTTCNTGRALTDWVAAAEVVGRGWWPGLAASAKAGTLTTAADEAFESSERTAWWFGLWTGNSTVDGAEFRFFGTTGCGDYTGFWLVRPDAPVIEQPVVQIGSEGERGVIARDLGDLLWLFAAGYGPAEALAPGATRQVPNEAFRAIAERYAPVRERDGAEIVAAAQAEFPDFSEFIDSLCR